MTTITLPRAVVEQAAEALQMCRLNGSQYLYGNERDLIFSAIMALRAALAQQAEPVEPVAMKTHGAWDGLELLDGLPDGACLYTAPPQRAPLTEGVLMGVYIDFDRTADPAWSKAEYLLRLFRAVERAHGIKE